MPSTVITESIPAGHSLAPDTQGTEYPDAEMPAGVHSEPPEDDTKYWDDLEKDIPGVESDYYQAITNEVPWWKDKRGRVAVLQMPHATSQYDGALEGLTPSRITWRTSRDSFSPPRSPNSDTSSSDASEGPEGFLFEDLNHFKKAMETHPPRKDEAGVPRFFDKQLIVLEDLNKDWVEVIGKTFQIPVRVFALHWASPSLYKRGRARLPLGQPAEEHFVLPYSEILPVDIRDGMTLISL